MKRVVIVGLAVLLVILISMVYAARTDAPEDSAQVIAAENVPQGFTSAAGPIDLEFPLDYGPHPDYQTEWWYYTGNLETDQGRHFGYQLTFFRRALVPPLEREPRASVWATDQIYFAHFAITDVTGGTHNEFERFARGAAGIAGAQAEPYQVWLESWRVEQVAPGVYRLRAEESGQALDLTLADQKGPVLQGDEGYSRKGPEPGNASYYYSLTRLETHGTVRIGDEEFQVEGLSWKDHEFSTSALGEGQVGWDWFALQLDDGSELMVFQLRRADGTVDAFSSGTFIAANGEVHSLSQEDFSIQVDDTWESSRTGAIYPAGWTVTVSSRELILRIEPYLADQEMDLSFPYWEGAVRIAGTQGENSLTGWGYVELTGYAASMEGQF